MVQRSWGESGRGRVREGETEEREGREEWGEIGREGERETGETEWGDRGRVTGESERERD